MTHLSKRCGVAAGSATVVVALLVGHGAQAEIVFSVAPGGPSGLDSSYIYRKGGVIAGGGMSSGLVTGDVINGFSQPQTVGDFLLCFSIDPLSLGSADPAAIGGFPPYNATQQAGLNQGAGDAFISTEAFDRNSMLTGPSLGLNNNVLVINQSPWEIPGPPGPTGDTPNDFGLEPNRSPDEMNPKGDPIDDVGGGGNAAPDAFPVMYYSLEEDSASLGSGESPADIFYDPTADGDGGDEDRFARADELGLHYDDDIDALAVFDDDMNGVFSEGDQVIFSLSRNSQSLFDLDVSPADMLSISFGESMPSLFAHHTTLGLAPEDNVNMLELVPLLGDSVQTTIEEKLNIVIPGPPTLMALAVGAVAVRRRRRH